jgi:hypothetical protein
VLFTSKNVSNVQPVHEQQPCEHSDFVSTLGVTSILINVNGDSAGKVPQGPSSRQVPFTFSNYLSCIVVSMISWSM